MLGGLYLAFEGAEKIYEYFVPHASIKERADSLSEEEFMEYEAKKVKSAILTDLILSIEIIVIALGTVLEKSLPIQVIVVSFIAVIATIGVYGFVALLVRMDDIGLKMIEIAGGEKRGLRVLGKAMVSALPKLIKLLSFVGTAAMLLVAGGIFIHNLHELHKLLDFMPMLLAELMTGVVIGFTVLIIEKSVVKIIKG